ncbi:hypothetical protein JR316_0003846 [Psilocybe cubensis]|uniref:Uncharacterized protein n=2 Tax=Psilocybe cubensis TaxID=181762 RepID=A0ACB8H9G8_PSICU|nr:hypothetical protein JR316_0003846 [Psilocybe cubensis]KAH9484365.1 hypothetical protein JR316_0003846 [Psilocybe cubensis]
MATFTPRQTSRTLNGKHTQVFMQTFADRIVILVTQIGKVGNLIQATLPATAVLIPRVPDPTQPNKLILPESSPAIQLTPLLGSAPSPHQQTLHSLYASQIATIVWTEEALLGLERLRRSVVVGLALCQRQGEDDPQGEQEVFQGVMSMLYDLLRS